MDRSRRLRWWLHLLLLAAYPLVIGAMSAGRAEGSEPALGREARTLMIVTGVELAVFGLVFAVAWLASRAPASVMYFNRFKPVSQVPLGLGYSLALRLGLAILIGTIAAVLLASGMVTQSSLQDFIMDNRPDVTALVDLSMLKQDPVYFTLTLTLISFVVGGLREELWRGGLLGAFAVLWPGRFGSRAGQLLAATLAAIIFGLGHAAQGPVGVILTGVLGLGLGMIVVLHRSIWPAVWAHGFFNATSLALLPWLSDKLPGL